MYVCMYVYIYIYIYIHVLASFIGGYSCFDKVQLGIHYRGVQWEGGAADGGSII